VTKGRIWKRKLILKSSYETHVSSSSFSRAESCLLLLPAPTASPCYWGSDRWDCFTPLEVMRWEVKELLAFLMFYLPYINEHCFILSVFMVCSHMYFSVVKIRCWVCSCNPHCRWKNSPNALSVQLYEQRTVAVTVHLHLYFHSVHNLSLYTVCNSSTGWCAGRIKLLSRSERKTTDHIKRLYFHNYRNAVA